MLMRMENGAKLGRNPDLGTGHQDSSNPPPHPLLTKHTYINWFYSRIGPAWYVGGGFEHGIMGAQIPSPPVLYTLW